MRITILSGLPEYLESALASGHIRIAQERAGVRVEVVDLRDYAQDAYRTIDDEPYGGGGGMVLKPEPVWKALQAVAAGDGGRDGADGGEDGQQSKPWVVLPTPKGEKLTQERLVRMSNLLSERKDLVFLCSRYKGIDERIRKWVDEEISLGDYVIGGGEAAALVMMEGIVRLLPEVVGDRESVDTDSFTCGLLSGPAYTRPVEFNGDKVPDVLLSGHHEEIRRWRRKQAIALTVIRRPDILAKLRLNDEDEKLLSEVLSEQARRG